MLLLRCTRRYKTVRFGALQERRALDPWSEFRFVIDYTQGSSVPYTTADAQTARHPVKGLGAPSKSGTFLARSATTESARHKSPVRWEAGAPC